MSEENDVVAQEDNDASYEEPTIQRDPEPETEVDPLAVAQEEKPSAKPQPTQTVPLPELINERKHRQALERELAEFRREGNLRLQELLDRQNELAKQLNPAPAEPDDMADPLGATIHGVRKLEQKLDSIVREQQNKEQQVASYQAEMNLLQTINNDAGRFMKEAPDYVDAVKHVQDSRLRQLVASGWDENAALEQIGNEVKDFSIRALQSHQSPAEAMYNLAKNGYGWQGDAKSNIDRINRSQAAVTASGGGTSVKVGSLEDLVKMSRSEFRDMVRSGKIDKLLKKMG